MAILLRRGIIPNPVANNLDPATTAWVNAVVAAGGTVSTTQTNRVDTLIKSLKSTSLFSKLDRLWLWGGESVSQQATIDIINLVTGGLNGTMTLSANGYTGDGSTGYFTSGVINAHSVGGYNYTDASATAFVYTFTNRQSGGNQKAIGANTAGQIQMNGYQFGGTQIQINGGSNITNSGGVGTNGLWVLTQLSGTATVYNWSTALGNSGSVGSVANASPLAPDDNITFAAFNSAGGFVQNDTGTNSIVGLGAGFSSTDVSNLSSALNTYAAAWGFNQY